uniref:Uncharacterized protein n=1 Tax=Siphoviridae sp. ctA4S13 TaxID=2826179 RepID=A0A8S5MQD9_9CAUD|nr:MAG TPA: hypothetical protein [Siphoviridae sp. ctA4S13]
MSLDGHTGRNTTTAFVQAGVIVHQYILTNVVLTQNAVLCRLQYKIT